MANARTDNEEDETCKLSTLDVLVAIFGCCDNFLRQKLAQKLFVCKLAIPFIYPLGSVTNMVMSLWTLRSTVIECLGRHNESYEAIVTDEPFPVVTFVRLGRPPLSKSKLMNIL